MLYYIKEKWWNSFCPQFNLQYCNKIIGVIANNFVNYN